MHLRHANLMRQPDEGGQLLQRLPQSGEPERKARAVGAHLLFQGDEILHIAHDAVEQIAAAHQLERLGLGRIKRNAHLVQPGIDQLAALLVAHQSAVGVEQHIGAARLQIGDHRRQFGHHHRLADAVQHHPLDFGKLIDDAGEQLPAHVGGRLQLLIGARAGGAQQIAAVRRLQIEADRVRGGDGRAVLADPLEVAARIGPRVRSCQP